MYQALARKWRPKNFKDLVGQKHVTQSLCYSLNQGHIHHAYLFTGTRGVGKTTIARIFAKSINCLNHGVSANPCGTCAHCVEIDEGRFPDLIEVDAASRTQVDHTRQLLSSVPYQPMKGRYKVYLIDEVHMLSDGSFNALLKTLEEPPEHVKFILATTDPQKIPATVISRCLQFQLKNMSTVQISTYLKHILQEEKIAFEDEALELLAEAGQGSMRDSLSILDQAISYGQGKVLTDEVANLLGAVPAFQVRKLFYLLAKGDARDLRVHYCALEDYAPDYSELLKRILYGLQEITVAQLKGERYSGEVHIEMMRLAEVLPVELVQLWYQIATDAWQSLPYQPNMAVAVEMALLRMLALQGVLPEQDIQKVQVPSNVPYLPDLQTISSLQEEEIGEKKNENDHFSNEAESVVEAINLKSKVEKEFIAEKGVDDDVPWQEESLASMPEAHGVIEEAHFSSENQEDNSLWQDLHEVLNQPLRWEAMLKALPEFKASSFVLENLYPVELRGDGVVLMACDEAGRLWATAENLNKLNEQLSTLFARKIRVLLQDGVARTAYSIHRDDLEEAQALKKERFRNHTVVQRLISEFDAAIDEDSIK